MLVLYPAKRYDFVRDAEPHRTTRDERRECRRLGKRFENLFGSSNLSDRAIMRQILRSPGCLCPCVQDAVNQREAH
jgi:hypothetical protein